MKNKNVTISVVMSVLNEKIEYVNKAVQSILKQTFQDYEFIIILDSPNNSEMLECLKTWEKDDSRIILLINKKNMGLAKSLNRGIEVAGGMYIARMDADDIAMPNRLERELFYLKEHDCDMVSSLVETIDENDNVFGSITFASDSMGLLRKLLPVQNVIVHPSVLMKTESVKELGGYRAFSACQDYDLWLRMITEGMKIGIINENLLKFRRHSNSITASKKYKQYLNEKYIRNLYKQRVKYGYDNFSEEHLEKYLEEHGANLRDVTERENNLTALYRQGLLHLKKRKLKGLILILKSLSGKSVRNSIAVSFQAKLIKRWGRGDN